MFTMKCLCWLTKRVDFLYFQEDKKLFTFQCRASSFVFVVILAWSAQSMATLTCVDLMFDQSRAKHYVEVLDGELSLAYDWKPRRNLKNKTIFLDGVSLSFPHSQTLANSLRAKGVPLIRVDMVGTGNSLKRQWDQSGQFGRNNEIPAGLQAEAVIDFIESISSNPVNLVGLSYGGGIAAIVARLRPDLIQNLMLVSPFVVDIGDLRSGFLGTMTRFNPFMKAYVDNERNNLLTRNFQSLLPDYLNTTPDVYFQALHALTAGIRGYDLRRILSGVETRTHLIVGASDEYVINHLYDESFQQVSQAYQGKHTSIEEGLHDLVQTQPDVLSQWVADIFRSFR